MQRRHKSRQFCTMEITHCANVILERLIWDQPFLRANWQEHQDVMYHGIDLNEALCLLKACCAAIAASKMGSTATASWQ